MKKQLLAAAVAATMASVASADVSITGAAKINYTYTDNDDSTSSNAFKNEMDLKVKGTKGDTTIVMNIEADNDDSNLGLEDTYVATKVGAVSIKVGDWDNGNNALRASGRTDNKFSASTTVGGVTLTYDAAGDSNGESVKLATTVGGVKVGYKAVSNGTAASNGEDISLATTIGGVNISYLALNRDGTSNSRDVWEISGKVAGMGVKVAQANAEANATIEGDTWMGDYEGASGSYDLTADQDVTAIELSTSMAGNTVKFRNVNIDGVTGADTSFNKVIVTRPLTNGTTFEATYTALDDDAVSNEGDTLDLELAVKF